MCPEIEISEEMVDAALAASDHVWEDNVTLEECLRRDMRAALHAGLGAQLDGPSAAWFAKNLAHHVLREDIDEVAALRTVAAMALNETDYAFMEQMVETALRDQPNSADAGSGQ